MCCTCRKIINNSTLQRLAKQHTRFQIGLAQDKQNNAWKASIKHKGKKIHIGLFSTQEEAAKAFDKKATELRGMNTKTNF